MPDRSIHPALHWRALTIDDAPAIAQLMNAVFAADAQPVRTSPDEVAHELAAPQSDLAIDSIGGFDEEGSLMARGIVSAREAVGPHVRVFLAGDVHPHARGRGIGTALLAWLEARGTERLRQLERGVDPAKPRLLATDYAAGAEDRAALQSAAGFRPMRWFAEMVRPLEQPVPPVSVPPGLVLVAWADRWNDEARDAHNDAFRDHWGSQPVSADEWRHHHADARSFEPGFSRLAVDGSTVAAYALCHRYPADEAVTGRTSVWLETIGVRRAYRRRGLASAVISAVLAALRDAGIDQAELGVDSDNPTGAFGLYERLGFREERRTVFAAKELRPEPA